ncbi:MAG TPA: hypothetical protein VKA84_12645 [Gemmatimonadaceae bacterium]|nr:hypothetical protein [Gemmatimonadaceae bacterium]
MRAPLLLACLAVFGCPGSPPAQGESARPQPGDYLLSITEQWGRESPLGDLRQRALPPGDIEARLWGGYGLVGTSGLVLRRRQGQWSAWRAQVHSCRMYIPIPVGDTMSAASSRRYEAEARAHCGEGRGDTLRAAVVISADTLALLPLSPPADADDVWRGAVARGVLTLPPRVPRRWMRSDGFTYVLEVRQGDEYRASVIEHTDPPESDADRQVQAVYAWLVSRFDSAATRRLVPLGQRR